jgi:hypothetical protein
LLRLDELVKLIRFDDFAQSPKSRRASRAERGVLTVRRSDGTAKRNAEFGLSAKSSGLPIRWGE